MKTLALILALTLATAASAATKIYQWTDEAGTVHFSNHPPEQSEVGTNTVTERTVNEAPRPGSVPPRVRGIEAEEGNEETEPPEDRLQAKIDAAAERQRAAAEREQLCERGRKMVAMIEPAERVQVQHPDGRVEWLYGDDRIAQLDRARQLVNDNCGPS